LFSQWLSQNGSSARNRARWIAAVS
jgi:hypothetical protein